MGGHALHGLIEVSDDVASFHLDRDHDRAMFVQRRFWLFAAENVHLEWDRRFIHASYFEQIPEINRCTGSADADHRAEQLTFAMKFAGKLDRKIVAFCAQCSAGDDRVAFSDRFGDGFRRQTITGGAG